MNEKVETITEERTYTKDELDEVAKITKEFQEIQKAKKQQWRVKVLEFLGHYGWLIAILLMCIMIYIWLNE